MDKEKEIEEMAQALYAPQLKEKNDGFGELCRGCRIWYEGESCEKGWKCDYYKSIVRHLVDAGYGNVAKAVKEFAEKLKERGAFRKREFNLFTERDIDELIKELYGED